LKLTIDANIQYRLEQIAGRVLTENKAEAVMLIAMENATGNILGSASLPGFDPNNFAASPEIYRQDRTAVWAYEPGSVFKVFSMAAMLDSGSIANNSVFYCDGHYEQTTKSGERIAINCLEAHGRVSPREIIIYSCNAGAAYASDRMGAGTLNDRLSQFGFGKRTGIGHAGETAGFLRPADRWSARSKPTIAMGQEIAVSALQMLQAASAVANDGVLVPPRIIAGRTGPGGKNIPIDIPAPRRILSAETARALRSYMVDVGSFGTGRRANVADFPIAVKTGTAQITDPLTGAYSKTDFIASCIALFPADSPSIILYIVIVRPKGETYLGGRIAAPPIREAAEALVNYLGIPRGRNERVNHPGDVLIRSEHLPELDGYIPDFRGYSKRTLEPLLLLDEIDFHIEGNGWVVSQDPPPRTLITRGMTVRLVLE
jgi:cell division protein FtsI (penicillin-binding protein 3)